MKLEQVAKDYGMQDYLDYNTGYIYQLSKAEEMGNNMLMVPMVDVGTYEFVGYALMEGVR